MNYNFTKVPNSIINWALIESCEDSTIYKTQAWFKYLWQWKGVEPFVVEISEEEIIGFFVGEVLNRGVRIVGSPFEGIGTGHQGLSLIKDCSNAERLEIYQQLSHWIFDNHFASFLQVEDWQIDMKDLEGVSIDCSNHKGLMIDLTLSEDELFHNLHQKSCRYSINKSVKSGITIRETNDPKTFIDLYYAQLLEVFDKQGLTPTYNRECVSSLVNALYPNHIILLEAITSDGQVAATGLFPGDNHMAIFWGGASFKKYQKFCPNEPLIWEAIKMWKARGTKVFDMCGVRDYKMKFGPIPYEKPRLLFARFRGLIIAKSIIKKAYYGIRSLKAKFK